MESGGSEVESGRPRHVREALGGALAQLGRRSFLGAALGSLAAAAVPRSLVAADDPLPSWNDGPAKRAIMRFVADVTRAGGPRYVAPEDRVATFDNDGTLWCERPTVEALYMLARAEMLLRKRPELVHQEPYATLRAQGPEALARMDPAALMRVFADTHTGMLDEEFARDAQAFLDAAKHPKFGVSFYQVAYVPQLELLAYVRSRGFNVWLCSGGETTFVRLIAERMYGVPPERVIGTSFRAKPEERDGRLALRRTGELLSFNDKDDKAANIAQRIGKRPILAVGNEGAGGDISMLRYAQSGPLPALAVLVNHDDAAREYSYAEKDGASLRAAQRYGFTLVSMKTDWRRVFAFDA